MSRLVKGRLQLLILAVAAAAVGLASWPRAAQADPHAMFLTVVGQQQLFFNVLAALNQADYVETLQLRDQLLQKRQAAGFDKETNDPSVTQTETDLANVLTRNITLEGYDQETAFIEREAAIERSRRRNQQAVTQLLCQIAFGVEKCETENRDPVEVQQEKEQAVVTNPKLRSDLSFLGGVYGPVSSSYEGYDQQVRKKIIQDKDEGEQQFPYLFSDEIASVKQVAKGDPRKELLVQNVLSRAENQYITEGLDAGFLANIRFDEDGVAQLNVSDTDPAEVRSGAFFNTLQGLVGLPLQVQSIVDQKADEAQVFLAAQEQNGFIGKVEQKPLPEGEIVKDIDGIITVPAAVRQAAASQAIDSIVSAEQNLQYTVPESSSTVSSTSAVNPVDPYQAPSVPGLRAPDENDSLVTRQFEAKYYGPQQEQAPSTPLKPIHLDDGSQTLFRQLGLVASDKPGLNLGGAGAAFNQGVVNRTNNP